MTRGGFLGMQRPDRPGFRSFGGVSSRTGFYIFTAIGRGAALEWRALFGGLPLSGVMVISLG